MVSAVSQVTAATFLQGTDIVGKSPETLTALHTQQLQEQPGTNKDQGVSSSCSIPVVLSPGRTCNEFHAEKEEMVHVTMLGLDQSRYSFKWQERLPFHGNMVVTLLPIII